MDEAACVCAVGETGADGQVEGETHLINWIPRLLDKSRHEYLLELKGESGIRTVFLIYEVKSTYRKRKRKTLSSPHICLTVCLCIHIIHDSLRHLPTSIDNSLAKNYLTLRTYMSSLYASHAQRLHFNVR